MIKILKYGEVANRDIFSRADSEINVEAIVTQIIENVKNNGDKALFEYCERFDRAKLDRLQVTEAEFEEAVAAVEPQFLEILKKAAANIRRFHEKQVRTGFSITEDNGVVIGQKITPVDRAGLYVPGGQIPGNCSGWFHHSEHHPAVHRQHRDDQPGHHRLLYLQNLRGGQRPPQVYHRQHLWRCGKPR